MLRGQLIEYKKRKHIVTIMSDLKSTKKADLKLKKADLKLKDLELARYRNPSNAPARLPQRWCGNAWNVVESGDG